MTTIEAIDKELERIREALSDPGTPWAAHPSLVLQHAKLVQALIALTERESK